MDPLSPIIDALHSAGRLRVWSLVITVFGDCVQARGGQIDLARLRVLLGRIGVTPGALRTAMSRLGAEGWVESERMGRRSLYRLSAAGLSQFIPATEAIYAPPRTRPVERWRMGVGPNPGALPVAGDAWIAPATGPLPEGAICVVEGQLRHLAPGARETLLGSAHRALLTGLRADLAALDPGALDPLGAAAARILLVHRWRRLVLRYPEVPADLLPPGLAGPDPRAAVADMYARLTPGAERWLSSDEAGLVALPPPRPASARRFAPARSQDA